MWLWLLVLQASITQASTPVKRVPWPSVAPAILTLVSVQLALRHSQRHLTQVEHFNHVGASRASFSTTTDSVKHVLKTAQLVPTVLDSALRAVSASR